MSTTRGAGRPAAVSARALAAIAIPFGPAPMTASVGMVARIVPAGYAVPRGSAVAGVDRVLGRRGGGPDEQADDEAGQEAEYMGQVGHVARAGSGVPGRVQPLQHEPGAQDQPGGDAHRD